MTLSFGIPEVLLEYPWLQHQCFWRCGRLSGRVGSAAAMSASALTELPGGTPQQCLDAASAISNLLQDLSVTRSED